MNDSVSTDDDAAGKAVPLDPGMTPEAFIKWHAPRFGGSNPELMNNPVWEWLVKNKISAYQANERLQGPSTVTNNPTWCFDRMGQSSNQLPDGRVILIAGEHEDFYDPDFYIYNDVVVRYPDGHLKIFGYPRAIFLPTDFHSATLVSNRLVLIGSLGYPEDRRPGMTQVLILDLETFAISTAQTSGASPGWIHDHKATLSDDGRSILVHSGKLDRGGKDKSLVENIDDWRLSLDGWRWERLTEHHWPQLEVRRKDGQRNHLFDYQQAVWDKKIPGLEKAGSKEKFKIPSLQEELGKQPDLNLFARLYTPPVKHESLTESDEEYNVHRIKIEGVIVRYVEEMDFIQMTVEGNLPQKTVDTLNQDLVEQIVGP